MVIVCSSCQARFKLADDKIKNTGTKVRCTKCREVFTVYPESMTQSTIKEGAVSPSQEIDSTDKIKSASAPLADNVSLQTEAFGTTSTPDQPEKSWEDSTIEADFSNSFFSNAEASDLDAISFDNIEAPVFSVSQPPELPAFNENPDFSFSDDVIDTPNTQSIELDNGFSAATDSPSPSQSKTENNEKAEDEYSFAPTANLTDFSWDDAEPGDSSDQTASTSSQISEEQKTLENDFDFNSFSFDEPTSSSTTEISTGSDDSSSSTNIELSIDSTDSSPSILLETSSDEIKSSNYPEQTVEREKLPENKSAQTRPVRHRTRRRKKESFRGIFKVLLLVLLILVAVYGVINRQTLQKEYKNLVNMFIEKQIIEEKSGKIGLTKLGGTYLLNEREGELFVIRGMAVNEFKGLRSSILVRGTIFDEKGGVLQSRTAYCGNLLKDERIKKSSMKEISEIMNNELGENLLNMNITPGKEIPFLIIFKAGTQKIKEFTIEVLDSKPGSK